MGPFKDRLGGILVNNNNKLRDIYRRNYPGLKVKIK